MWFPKIELLHWLFMYFWAFESYICFVVAASSLKVKSLKVEQICGLTRCFVHVSCILSITSLDWWATRNWPIFFKTYHDAKVFSDWKHSSAPIVDVVTCLQASLPISDPFCVQDLWMSTPAATTTTQTTPGAQTTSAVPSATPIGMPWFCAPIVLRLESLCMTSPVQCLLTLDAWSWGTWTIEAWPLFPRCGPFSSFQLIWRLEREHVTSQQSLMRSFSWKHGQPNRPFTMAMTRSTKAALLITVRTSRRPPWWRLVCVITNFKVSSIAPWRKGATSFRIFRPLSNIFRPPSPSPSRLWHQSPVKSRRVSRHDYHSKDLHLTITNSINACNVESLRPNSGVFQWCLIAQRNDKAIIRIKNLINDINSNVSINASSNIHYHYVRKYRYILWVTSI